MSFIERVNLKELTHFLLNSLTNLFIDGLEHSNSQYESKEKDEGRYDLGKVNNEDSKWTVA